MFSCLALSFSDCQSELFTLQMPSDMPNISTMLNTPHTRATLMVHLQDRGVVNLWSWVSRQSVSACVRMCVCVWGWGGVGVYQPPLNWKVLE